VIIVPPLVDGLPVPDLAARRLAVTVALQMARVERPTPVESATTSAIPRSELTTRPRIAPAISSSRSYRRQPQPNQVAIARATLIIHIVGFRRSSSLDFSGDVITYLPLDQLPRSMSLHRSLQNGMNGSES